MVSYIVGGAALFAIGFITYEVYESIRATNEAARNALNAVENPNNLVEGIGIASGVAQPLSYAAGGLGSLLGESFAHWVTS